MQVLRILLWFLWIHTIFMIRRRGLLCRIWDNVCKPWLFWPYRLLRFWQSEYLHSTFFSYVCLSWIRCFRKPVPYRKSRTFLTSAAPPYTRIFSAARFISSWVVQHTLKPGSVRSNKWHYSTADGPAQGIFSVPGGFFCRLWSSLCLAVL